MILLSQKPIATLAELLEFARAAEAAGRHPDEVYLREPVTMQLYEERLTDGSTVLDVAILVDR
jgi:hypothetical protein